MWSYFVFCIFYVYAANMPIADCLYLIKYYGSLSICIYPRILFIIHWAILILITDPVLFPTGYDADPIPVNWFSQEWNVLRADLQLQVFT